MNATTDGRYVVSGALLFRLKDSHGLPPDMAADAIYGKGMAINWAEFVTEAKRHGWTASKAIKEVDYALMDHRDVREQVVSRLNGLFI